MKIRFIQLIIGSFLFFFTQDEKTLVSLAIISENNYQELSLKKCNLVMDSNLKNIFISLSKKEKYFQKLNWQSVEVLDHILITSNHTIYCYRILKIMNSLEEITVEGNLLGKLELSN